MSSADQAAELGNKSALLEETYELPAFHMMGEGYKFVFGRLPQVARLGWKDFTYGIAVLFLSSLADAFLFGRSAHPAFSFVLVPLAGYFVLRFAVRWHRYAGAARWPGVAAAPQNANFLEKTTAAYTGLFFICAIILVTPVVALVAAVFLLDVPEAFWLAIACVIVAIDFYLAARMSILFAQTALTGALPPRWTWRLSNGVVWKLVLIMIFAPWPFNAALKLLDKLVGEPDSLSYVPLIFLMVAISFVGIAVLTTILTDAYLLCLRRNQDWIRDMRSRFQTREEPSA